MRLEGTNKEEGRKIHTESGLNFAVDEGMKDAAEKVVRLAGGARFFQTPQVARWRHPASTARCFRLAPSWPVMPQA